MVRLKLYYECSRGNANRKQTLWTSSENEQAGEGGAAAQASEAAPATTETADGQQQPAAETTT